MTDKPEERARERIDRALDAAGWVVQDRDAMSLGAAIGVAVREFPLTTGEADYLLFVDRQAIGAIEAKPRGSHAKRRGRAVREVPNRPAGEHPAR